MTQNEYDGVFDEGYKYGKMDAAKDILLWLVEHLHESDYAKKMFKEKYGVELDGEENGN